MQLASLLSSVLGVALPSTVAFDYPTVDAISRFLLESPAEVICCHACSHTFGILPRHVQGFCLHLCSHTQQAPVLANAQGASNELPRALKLPLLKQHSERQKHEAFSFSLQDEIAPQEPGRRKSSFTQLLGQTSGLQDIFRRCSWSPCLLTLKHAQLLSVLELS